MSNVRNTPQAIGTSGGTDNQGNQQDQTAVAFPGTVDALAGMQYPDMPGGPVGNAPRGGQEQITAPYDAPGTAYPNFTKVVANSPTFGAYFANPKVQVGTQPSPVPDMPQYGSTLSALATSPAPLPEE